MAKEGTPTTDWVAVAARSQAYQALHLAGLAEKTITEKARFLMVLGLTRADAAVLLSSSDESLRKLLARAAKRDAEAAAQGTEDVG